MQMRRQTLLAAGLMVLLGWGIGGCRSGKLETGYRYRPLGANEAQRRAFYAPEYSREASAVERPETTDPTSRRPGR